MKRRLAGVLAGIVAVVGLGATHATVAHAQYACDGQYHFVQRAYGWDNGDGYTWNIMAIIGYMLTPDTSGHGGCDVYYTHRDAVGALDHGHTGNWVPVTQVDAKNFVGINLDARYWLCGQGPWEATHGSYFTADTGWVTELPTWIGSCNPQMDNTPEQSQFPNATHDYVVAKNTGTWYLPYVNGF